MATTVDGGADVVPTTRTIPHWWGATLDPLDGITYGYNIVGADPSACSGTGCDTTVEVDMTPIVLRVDGMTFSASDVVAAALASPEFALNDYGSTAIVSGPTADSPPVSGGVLSQQDAGRRLQLQDAIMRAQFGRTGSSSYHVRLHPNLLPTVTIDVPQNQGLLFTSTHGIVFAGVDYGWWSAQIHNLETKADPQHLALYLTDDTATYVGNANAFQLVAIGFHGAKATGSGGGSTGSNGNAAVQTFAWATWLSPGFYPLPGRARNWVRQDMTVVSHEVAEWADDPFVNNAIQPWPFTPGVPAAGCNTIIETGDAVGSAGFTVGTNTFQQGPNPDGTQSADGYYHPQDEVFLPWFLRLAPNTTSEPTQTPSANRGRYTFMGDLNTFPGFDAPAPVC
jgi:hypothetical protein